MLQTNYAYIFSRIGRKTALLIGFWFCCLHTAFGQEQTVEQDDQQIRDLMESLAPDLPEDYDLSELFESLSYLRSHPINLNKAQAEELKALVFLSPLQISNLIKHIQSNGKLIDLLELQSIDSFDVLTIERMMPFVRISIADSQQTGYKDLRRASEQQLLLRFGRVLEQQRGFTDLPGSRYLGSPERLLGKYRFTYKDQLSASLVFEKDAGEYLFSGAGKRGFDFMSGNISINQVGVFRKVIIGDYSMQFGQGLTLWSGFGFGKGPDVTSVAKKDAGLRPYSSSNENSYFRGVATTVGLAEHLQVTGFFSRTLQDASTKTNEAGQITQVNIGVSGLHRTSTELKNRNTLEQTTYGTALQYVSNNLNIGFVAHTSRYSNAFVAGPLAYNRYNFVGTALSNAGLHYSYTFQNIYFYGETARSFPGGMASVNGALVSLSKSFSLALVNRNYAKDHHNFFARSLGESSEASNERGWYAGLNYTPNRKWLFSWYGDAFQFPWLKYRIDAPSSGYEMLVQGMYTPTKTFKVVFRAKTERKQQNSDLKTDSTISNVDRRNYRIATNWRLSRTLGFENRLELANYRKEQVNELGYLIYQDVDYRPANIKLSGNMRLAYFHSASYDSRIYAYEDDVLYSSGFGMYNGTGWRTYLNLQYKMNNKLSFWARYATFLYQDVETVGSGLDRIEGNKKMEVKFQLRYKF